MKSGNPMISWSAVKSRLSNKFKSNTFPALIPGVHHYLHQDEHAKVRLHLRVEEDGHGLLLVNASRVYHFNPTAAYMAYLLLEEIPLHETLSALTHQYNVPTTQARKDLSIFAEQLQVITQPENCPVCDLELETTAPFSSRPSAPYRMDLAVTYHCNNDCAHCYNGRGRDYPEINTERWKKILDKLWELSIPHVVFTGGEPTLREDLPELIAHAENNGQITGLNTNGRRLKDPDFVKELVAAGLDHVQITLESHDSQIHDEMVGREGAWKDTVAGIQNALASKLFVMTNTTLLKNNCIYLEDTLAFLAELGIPTIGLNSLIYAGHGLSTLNGVTEETLIPLAALAREKAEAAGQRLVWYTPTQYCQFNPIDLDLGVKGCTAALYSMCIEPDGSVIPCQSYYQSLGKLLEEPWDSIWNHELALSLRERKNVPLVCNSCALLQECGGGCPLAREAGAYSKPQPIYPQFEECERFAGLEV
jgi:radical SAM protein with 4Fe4S-binding SPASM domain